MCLRLSDADRASPSATYKLSSNVVRVAGRASRDRWLVSIFFRRRVIQADHSDRSGAEPRAPRKTGNASGPWETQIPSLVEKSFIVPPRRLKLTEQQSWQGIAQSKGMTYLQRLPRPSRKGNSSYTIPSGRRTPSGRTVSAPGCKCKMSTLNPATVGGPLSWVRTIA